MPIIARKGTEIFRTCAKCRLLKSNVVPQFVYNTVIHTVVSSPMIAAYIKKSILNILLEIRAKGVEITVDFKYKVQTASYISNGAFVGVKRILKIEDSFYDEILQQKSYESNLARINVITQEGVR